MSAKKELQTTDEPQLPADLIAQLEADAGKGISSRPEDNIIPRIKVLQALSPECRVKGPDYIEGAEPGMFYLISAVNPLIKGDEGIDFVPVFREHKFVEWIPRERGGGMVAQHDDLPAGTIQEGFRTRMPNGNDIIETIYWVGFVVFSDKSFSPYVIPFSSTALMFARSTMTETRQRAKAWMYHYTKKTVEGPLWSVVWRLTTKDRSNNKGSWASWSRTFDRWVEPNSDLYNAARQLYDERHEKTLDTGEPEAVEEDKVPF